MVIHKSYATIAGLAKFATRLSITVNKFIVEALVFPHTMYKCILSHSGGANPPAVVRQTISGYSTGIYLAMCQQRQQRRPLCLRAGRGSATPPALFWLRF